MGDSKYDLVFEGGGAKGIAFIGALRALEEAGIRPGRLLGTSAGAIVATLIAAGFSAEQLQTALLRRLPNGKRRLSLLADVPTEFSEAEIAGSRLARWLKAIDLPFIPERIEAQADQRIIKALLNIPAAKQVFSFAELGGLYAGDEIVRWLTEQLDSMDGLGKATMADLYEHTGHELTLTAADITERRLLILNHRTAPRLPVVWAVRMSSSVPFYWQEVTWRAAWGPYRDRILTGHKIVDGGVLSNFPMELFLSADSYVTDVMGPPTGKTLGFLIDEESDLPGQFTDPSDRPFLNTALVLQRVLNIIETMMQAHDKLVLDAYSDYVAMLPARGYGSFEFDMSDERLDALVEAAYDATRRKIALWQVPRPASIVQQVAFDEVARRVVSR